MTLSDFPPRKEPIPEEAGLAGVGHSFKKKINVHGCLACMYVRTLCTLGAFRGQKVLGALELALQKVIKMLHGCWDLNPAPLQQQPVLLTTEPPLQPLVTHSLRLRSCRGY